MSPANHSGIVSTLALLAMLTVGEAMGRAMVELPGKSKTN